jgi:4-amino-4-deoxy-L-arabinose transferase-like glycosyltransferase
MQPVANVTTAPPRIAQAQQLVATGWSALRQHYAMVLLVAILALGLGLRLYQLGGVPAGFFCDEASIGYNAYTLLADGTDEYGIPHPFFFRAFGEYKSPVEIYSTVPFVAVFGLTEIAVRLPSVLYGELGILALYLLVGQLFKASPHREALALLAALFLAISPWDVQFSRVALEGLTAWVFFTTLALYLFLKAQERPWLLPGAMVVFALALYSYFPARIFVPLLGIGLCGIYWRFFRDHWREAAVAASVLIVCLIPFVQNQFSPEGFARWQQVSIFAHPPADQPVWQHIALNYLSHFSLDFLFTKGDIGMPGQAVTRHSVRGMGELYLYQLPLVLLGIWSLASAALKRPPALRREALVIALWLVLFPVGSMFTTDPAAQATRSIIGVVPWQIVSAVGLVYLFQLGARLIERTHGEARVGQDFLAAVSASARPAGIATAGAAVLIFFAAYLPQYFVAYNGYASDFWGWQYGPRQIVHYYTAHEASYDELVMISDFNAPEIFFRFYAPDDCANCIVGVPSDSYKAGQRQLFALTPDFAAAYAGKIKTVDTIRYPDGETAFVLVEFTAAP